MQDVIAAALGALLLGALVQVGAAAGAPIVGGLVGLGVVAVLARSYLADRGGTTSVPDLPARRARWILAVVVLGALAIRLYTLMDRPAWDDEMWTLRNLYTSDWGELFRVAFDDYWPPLHYIILNSLARVTNTGIFWLRIPSVVFGAASVAALYWLGMVLFRNRIAALAAAALLAGMTSHVVYSQEARVYALQILLVIASAGFFYRSYWERRISPAFIVATCLLTYAHSFASWYFVAGECVYVAVAWLVWRDGKAFRQAFLSQVIVLLLWMPLVAGFVWARFRRGIVVPSYWATGDEPGSYLLTVVELYQGLGVRSWVGAAFMVLFFGLAALVAWKRRRPERAPEPAARTPGMTEAVLFLACWLAVPVLFSLSISTLTSMNSFPEIRYHMTVVPAICLMAAAGFSALRTRTQVLAAACVIVLLPVAELPRYYRGFQRDALDEAAAIVRQYEQPGETIYVGNAFRVFAYYYRGFFPRIGSAQWDSLTAATAHLTDETTLESPKWGDTYAYEKMPPNVRYYGYYGYRPDRYELFVENEVARGGFTGGYWLVLEPGERRRLLLAAMERHGRVCEPDRTFELRGVTVLHCPPTG